MNDKNIMKNPEQKKIFLTSLVLAALFGVFAVLLTALHLPIPRCAFHRLTGLYCPGCGGTRAFFALLHGHFLQSLVYHPVVLYGAAVYLTYALRNLLALVPKDHRGRLWLGMAFQNSYLYMAAVLIVTNWLLKNFLLCIFHLAM